VVRRVVRSLTIAALLATGFLVWYGFGQVPVPADRGNWHARGKTPTETALAFIQPVGEVRVEEHMPMDADSATVFVTEAFPGDDATDSIDYEVTVRFDGQAWYVDSATYEKHCKRGISFWGSGCS
jgi:hypothetical protein